LYPKLKDMSAALNEVIKNTVQRDFDAKETLQVLTINKSIYWSWGVSQRYADKNYLLLKVSGHHHKGYVLITLNYNDTYKVSIVSYRGKLLQTFDEVYFDQLTEIIDNRIEKIKDYVF